MMVTMLMMIVMMMVNVDDNGDDGDLHDDRGAEESDKLRN